ncbi:MAG TPA: hypothetical protein VM012_12470 [Flavitalea sp.]|nr:hypothetical protein [Flavitalea sp.]
MKPKRPLPSRILLIAAVVTFRWFYLLPAILLVSCDGSKAKRNSMAGAYSMYKQVVNNGTKDSIIDRNQLKIYTDKHIMYAGSAGSDSFANYGIGTYEVKDNKIYEYIFLRSSQGSVATRDTAVLAIQESPTGYMQVIEQILVAGSKYKLTEQYDNVGKDRTSPLDGAWKQTQQYRVTEKGDTTTLPSQMQYKIYQSGYFIWTQSYKDTANKSVSVFGYGSFEMDGKNKSRETTLNSTFRTALMGKTYELVLEFPKKDIYKQTIEFNTGVKSVEVYSRLEEK